jgi:hypothetical protein
VAVSALAGVTIAIVDSYGSDSMAHDLHFYDHASRRLDGTRSPTSGRRPRRISPDLVAAANS